MQITLRLLAIYRRYLPAGHDAEAGYPVEVTPGTRVADLLPSLPVPQTDAYTVLVNGRHAERDQILQAGDVLSVFPAAGGGY
jgi:molybdopterin synthase sulfur carrier subunit